MSYDVDTTPTDAQVEETLSTPPEERSGAHPGPPEEPVDAVPGPPEETVDAVPVLAEARPLPAPAPAALPAVQAAAVAATGFVAGAATVALVKRHSARKLARSRNAPRRPVDMLPIVGSRTFLVDVHLLAKPSE